MRGAYMASTSSATAIWPSFRTEGGDSVVGAVAKGSAGVGAVQDGGFEAFGRGCGRGQPGPPPRSGRGRPESGGSGRPTPSVPR